MAIDGTYIIVANTPMGAQETKLEVKQEGNVITGTGTALGKSLRIENGQVAGNTAAFTISADTPFGPMKLNFKLTFDGDKVTGEAISPFGAMPIKGKRA